MRTSAVAVIALLLTALSPATFTASAEDGRSIGDRYLDGLDSRHSSVRTAQMAREAGYTASGATNGRTADNAWLDGLSSQIFGFFGHSNAGIIQVKDRAGINNDEYIAAGTFTDRLPLYANYRFWSEYLPYTDVDDMRLAILAGCYTANSDATLGDFEEVGTDRGIDAIVAFPGLVYYPSKCTSCNYSGNYFWSRFATHFGGGARLSVALARARTDLVDKEGDAGGWQRYRITGSIDYPGRVRLRPVGNGEPLTSQPAGIDPYMLSSLTITSTNPLPDGLVEVSTEEGVLLRRNPGGGRLVDLWAPASTTGAIKHSVADLHDEVTAFLAEVVNLSDWELIRAANASHVAGESLAQFTWKTTSSVAQPARIDVEVDRRTGAVTYLGWAAASRELDPALPLISAEQAEAIAVQHAAAGSEVVAVDSSTWTARQWLVRTRNSTDRGPLGPQFEEFAIDAVTGELLQQSAT